VRELLTAYIDNGSLTLVQYRANYDVLPADINICLSEAL
jgi:hypothetical protein